MGHVFGRFIMLWTGVSDMLNENSSEGKSGPNGEVFVYGYASGEGFCQRLVAVGAILPALSY